MIINIKVGDITAPENNADLIIGMNSQLIDVYGIGKPFVNKINTIHPIMLGSVLSFTFDDCRNLHMLICHHLGKGGWNNADKYVRYGMDYLWHSESNAKRFSIVQIGTGRVGIRDDADSTSIRTAMANSFLPVDLFIFEQPKQQVNASAVLPLRAYRHFHPVLGEERLIA
jgi:hypothetical protein